MKRGRLKREGELLKGGGGELLERGAYLRGGLNRGFRVYEPKVADSQVTS